MITKVVAAKRAARSGAHTVIASGRVSDVLLRLARGEPLGTLLVSETQPLTARKQWLADHLQLNGKLILDGGAIKALKKGKSLLPIGVVAVQGEFERGAAVACVSAMARRLPAAWSTTAAAIRDGLRAAPARILKTFSATSTSRKSSIATT
jgi:glutamate 5-kinase